MRIGSVPEEEPRGGGLMSISRGAETLDNDDVLLAMPHRQTERRHAYTPVTLYRCRRRCGPPRPRTIVAAREASSTRADRNHARDPRGREIFFLLAFMGRQRDGSMYKHIRPSAKLDAHRARFSNKSRVMTNVHGREASTLQRQQYHRRQRIGFRVLIRGRGASGGPFATGNRMSDERRRRR